MALWSKGEVAALLEEGRCLQKRLPRGTARSPDCKLADVQGEDQRSPGPSG